MYSTTYPYNKIKQSNSLYQRLKHHLGFCPKQAANYRCAGGKECGYNV